MVIYFNQSFWWKFHVCILKTLKYWLERHIFDLQNDSFRIFQRNLMNFFCPNSYFLTSRIYLLILIIILEHVIVIMVNIKAQFKPKPKLKVRFTLTNKLMVYIIIHTLIYAFNNISSSVNNVDFDLKSVNQEFLLLLKLLKKYSIQYFTIEL